MSDRAILADIARRDWLAALIFFWQRMILHRKSVFVIRYPWTAVRIWLDGWELHFSSSAPSFAYRITYWANWRFDARRCPLCGQEAHA